MIKMHKPINVYTTEMSDTNVNIKWYNIENNLLDSTIYDTN